MGVHYREEPCARALTRVRGMPFKWSLNPYTGCAHRCTFCYVRAFERMAERASGDGYGRSIRVKTNIAEALSAETLRRGWKREQVAIGSATDPYQPAEGRYRLTRRCIGVLAEAHTPLTLVTRGPMIVRDIDVLQDAARAAGATVTFSVPTLDAGIWRRTEPATAPPRQRLRALQRLVEAGLDAGVGIAPILPGLSDDPAMLRDVVAAARQAGATFVWANTLYLKPGTREHFMEALGAEFPELVSMYETLYDGRAYLERQVSDPVRAEVRQLVRHFDVRDRRSRPVVVEPARDDAPRQLSML